MSIKQTLDDAVARWDLLRHPFYQAWTAGTLPKEALSLYAREYGAFLRLLPRGWESLEDAETAEEEREHAAMWDGFAAALRTSVHDLPTTPQAQALAASAGRLFGNAASAAGALYAFEVQQPLTAQSKLEGMKAHYKLPATAQRYFETHTNNQHEAEKLLRRIDSLPIGDRAHALQACSEMAQRLWDALSGIYGEACHPK